MNVCIKLKMYNINTYIYIHISFKFRHISSIRLVGIHLFILNVVMIVVHCQSALWSDPPGKQCDVDATYMLFHKSNLSTQSLGHIVSTS